MESGQTLKDLLVDYKRNTGLKITPVIWARTTARMPCTDMGKNKFSGKISEVAVEL